MKATNPNVSCKRNYSPMAQCTRLIMVVAPKLALILTLIIPHCACQASLLALLHLQLR